MKNYMKPSVEEIKLTALETITSGSNPSGGGGAQSGR